MGPSVAAWKLWLREQAQAAYRWNPEKSYWEIHTIQARTAPTQTLRDAFAATSAYATTNGGDIQTRLAGNFMFRTYPRLSPTTQKTLEDFFAANHLENFAFLDHGGRALAFRATHKPTGESRIARLEAPHSGRNPRPTHNTVLLPYAENQNDLAAHGNIKLEILPEILPISKLPHRQTIGNDETLAEAFHKASYYLCMATNLTYPDPLHDYDATAANIGLLPNGAVVTLDPEIEPRLGLDRRPRYRAFLQNAPDTEIATLYGHPNQHTLFKTRILPAL